MTDRKRPEPRADHAVQIEMLGRSLRTAEAVATSDIEGEILDGDSVQFSIRCQLGLAADDGNAVMLTTALRYRFAPYHL